MFKPKSSTATNPMPLSKQDTAFIKGIRKIKNLTGTKQLLLLANATYSLKLTGRADLAVYLQTHCSGIVTLSGKDGQLVKLKQNPCSLPAKTGVLKVHAATPAVTQPLHALQSPSAAKQTKKQKKAALANVHTKSDASAAPSKLQPSASLGSTSVQPSSLATPYLPSAPPSTDDCAYSLPSDVEMRALFFPDTTLLKSADKLDNVLVGSESVPSVPACGLLGAVISDTTEDDAGSTTAPATTKERDLFLNTHAPFCLVALGVQGSGKSHSIATVIENSMLHAPPYLKVPVPIATLVFHFDQDPENYSEAITLTTGLHRSLPAVQRMVVFVSPSFYQQRTRFYRENGIPNCTVKPRLFRWAELGAPQIQTLMHAPGDGTGPLYMDDVLNLLRKLQKTDRFPSWPQFKEQLDALKLSPVQRQPLNQRLRLIESLLVEAPENASFSTSARSGKNGVYIDNHSGDSELFDGASVASLLAQKAGDARCPLIIVDLTDPMMSGSEANSVFQVLLGSFLKAPIAGGKLVVLDEAHKYLQNDGSGLTADLVTACAQMRHTGLRLAISTQSPKVLPAELLELVSVVMIHKIQSPDWFTYLKTKLPLHDDLVDCIMRLETGSAYVVSTKWAPSAPGDAFVRKVRIRARITKDGGVSKTADRGRQLKDSRDV